MEPESGGFEFQVIELHMLEKSKYFPMVLLSGSSLRAILYPFTLIKTRIQLQRSTELYNGTGDAFVKIVRSEGFKGLYRGFALNCCLIVPSMAYISIYETLRHNLKQIPGPFSFELSSHTRAFIAGGTASLVAQTLIVPIDVVSQYLMVLGISKNAAAAASSMAKTLQARQLVIPAEASSSKLRATWNIIKSIFSKFGFKGFYRGYGVSVLAYAPGSALWWFFYDAYCSLFSRAFIEWKGLFKKKSAGELSEFLPSRVLIQCLAGPASSCTVCMLTNPLDVLRARIQLLQTPVGPTWRQLWSEEKLGIFTKSLSARLIQSVTHSFFIVLGYETVKKLALREEYKNSIKW